MINKITITIIALFLLTSSNLFSQLEQGNVIITPYYGGPNFGKLFGKLIEKEVDYFNIETGAGPYGIRGEYLVHEKFSVGFDFIYNEVSGSGYVDSTINEILVERYTIDARSKRFRFLLRGNFHFYSNENITVYTGLGIGLNIRKIELNYNIPYFENGNKNITGALIPVSGRFAIGTTYYPVKFLGLNVEFGIGGPIVSGGLSFKF